MIRYKYPRTPHLPWSPGASHDDIKIIEADNFIDHIVVVTEKMDGENTTMYNDYIHARSLESSDHISRSYIKRMHADICHLIPNHWRVCGENVYAKHSIYYKELESYFYLFSIWNENNICLNWEETKKWGKILGFPTPPELYKGIWNEKAILNIALDSQQSEGYVVRIIDSFPFEQFKKSVAKYVRKNHITSDSHWMYSKIISNKLKSNGN